MLGSNVFVYQLGAASHSVMLLFPTFLTVCGDLLEKERHAYHCIAVIVCLLSSIMQDRTEKFSKTRSDSTFVEKEWKHEVKN